MHPALIRPIPIWQAPTGSIAGPELCTAVSTVGGMGAMGLTWTPPATAAEAVREACSRTTEPFLVNFALAFEPIALQSVLDAGAPIVSFSWGQPGRLIDTVHKAGALVGVAVGSSQGASIAVQDGADFLIAQGLEAGGHVQSTTPLNVLLPDVLEVAGTVPVVAAGGIAMGSQVATILRTGALGVMMGTRFVATLESRAHAEYRDLLVSANAADTVLTGCFDVGWPQAPHRVLRNSTFKNWEASGYTTGAARPGNSDVIATTQAGAGILRYEDTAPMVGMHGNIEAMCCYAGQGVGGIQSIISAADVVERLWNETQAALLGQSD